MFYLLQDDYIYIYHVYIYIYNYIILYYIRLYIIYIYIDIETATRIDWSPGRHGLRSWLSLTSGRAPTPRQALVNDELHHTLWQYNIAIENGPFIVDLPIKDGDFPVRYVSHYQRVNHEILRFSYP